MEDTPAIPTFLPFMKFCQYFLDPPVKKTLACSTNTYNPLKPVFPYSGQMGLGPHHTHVHSLVPADVPETWIRTLAPWSRRWPCSTSPEMASEAGTPSSSQLVPWGTFQKIIPLFTLQAYISQAFTLATICLVI